MEQIKKKWEQWIGGSGSQKRVRWILAAGMIGMVLILLSELWPQREKVPENALQTSVQWDSGEYARGLEEKVLSLVTNIQGVGEAKVWVTLESGAELVYAREEVKNTDTTQSYGEDGIRSLHEKDNSEQKLILVEGTDGRRQPVVRTQKEPVVQGVVVVCQGARDMSVVERVTAAVTCALGISSSRVCVTQLRS